MGQPHVTAYGRYRGGEQFDAVVIGSGLGGLGVAALLARQSRRRVLVLERHFTAGGYTHTFKRRGFSWDVGVHYVGEVARPGRGLARLFEGVTATPLEWADMGEVYDEVTIAGRPFAFPRGREAMRAMLGREFPRQGAALDRYFQLIDQVARAKLLYFGERLLPAPLATAAGWAMRRAFERLADRTTREVLRELTSDQELIAVLTAQWGNYGLPPSESSFAIHALVVAHYLGGGAFPVGGAGRIAEAIAPVITEAGGAILVGAEVRQVLVDGETARGVELVDGRRFHAPVVVSDAGFVNTVERLLPDHAPGIIPWRAAAARLAPSTPYVALYLGLDGDDATLGLRRANRWLHPEVDGEAALHRWRADPDPSAPAPMLFLSFPSAKDPSWAGRHPGHAAVDVVTLARWDPYRPWIGSAWRRRGEAYEAAKQRLTEQLLARVYGELPQLRGRLLHVETSTPLSTHHFSGHPQGAMYGLAATPARFRERALRPRTPIRGLFLTGQDVLAPGLGGALAGAYLCASAIVGRPLFPL